jgi:uncharacterized RDD family membrane protein YckC
MEYENPYDPPKSTMEKSNDYELYEDAHKGHRLLNNIIDTIIILILTIIVLVVWQLQQTEEISDLLGRVAYILMSLVYFVFFELTIQRTPAKLITRTKVVNTEGGKPSISKIIGRSFARFVPFDAFSFLSNTNYGWHDRWSGTRVVRLKKVKE